MNSFVTYYYVIMKILNEVEEGRKEKTNRERGQSELMEQLIGNQFLIQSWKKKIAKNLSKNYLA